MRSVHLRFIVTMFASVLVLSLPAFSAAAQKTKPVDRLTAVQIRELAASTSAADHRTLSRHFAALAAEYTADAADHEALAKALRASPNPSETKRPGAPDTAAHCERLASLARQAAGEARQLATAHEQLAGMVK
jgi:hypothetical protein